MIIGYVLAEAAILFLGLVLWFYTTQKGNPAVNNALSQVFSNILDTADLPSFSIDTIMWARIIDHIVVLQCKAMRTSLQSGGMRSLSGFGEGCRLWTHHRLLCTYSYLCTLSTQPLRPKSYRHVHHTRQMPSQDHSRVTRAY